MIYSFARALVACIMVLTVAATCVTAGGPTRTLESQFAVVPGALVSADADNATFIVREGPPGTVAVSATLYNASYVDYYAWETVAVAPAPGVNISAHVPDYAATKANSTITLTLPPDVRLQITSTHGSIEVDGALIGGGELVTTEGNIVLKSTRGRYTARTTNSEIRLSDVTGTYNVATTNGSINFTGQLSSDGASRFETTNGNIEVNLKGDPDLAVEAVARNGPILVEGLRDEVRSENRVTGVYGTGTGRLELAATLGSIEVHR